MILWSVVFKEKGSQHDNLPDSLKVVTLKSYCNMGLMMTPSNGNIFHVTGPLWGESTVHQWIPLTKKASGAELWNFLWLRLNKQLSKQLRRQGFGTPSHSLWCHCNGLHMLAADPGLFWWLRIFVHHLVIIIKSEVWIIGHCLVWGHETMGYISRVSCQKGPICHA